MSSLKCAGWFLGFTGILLALDLTAAGAETVDPYHAVMVVPPASAGWAQVAGFIDIEKNLLVKDRIVVRMNYDAEGLNFFFKIPKRADYTLRAAAKGHDGELWFDDSLEVFVQVPGVAEYFQFIVNSKGMVYDAASTGMNMNVPSWDSRLKPEVKIEKTFWQVSFKILFSDIKFDLKKNKPVLRGNIAFDWNDPAAKRALAWCYTGGVFHKPEAFAEWLLSDQLPFVEKIDYRYQTAPGQKEYAVEYRLKNPSAKAYDGVGPGTTATVTKHFDLPKQVNLLQLASGDFFKYGFRTRSLNIATLDVFAVDSQKMAIHLKDMERWVNVPLTAKVFVDKRDLGSYPWMELSSRRFDYTKLAPGEHEVEVILADANGRQTGRAAKKIKLIDTSPIPYKLADLDASKYYSPVAIKPGEVRAARSVFDLSKGGMPQQITVNSTAMLVEPIKLIFKGQELVCDPEVKILEQNKNLVKILSHGRLGSCDVRVTSSFYYDGLVWNEVEMTGKDLTYGPLQIVVPVKSSKNLVVNHSSMGRDELFTKVGAKKTKAITDIPDYYNTAYLPDAFALKKDLDLALSDYVAIGSCADEPYGLGLVSEGPLGWNLKNYDHVFQFRRRSAARVDFVMNISDGATAWKKDKIAFTFGYQPIPVRKYPPDHNNKVHVNNCTVPLLYPQTTKNAAGQTVTYARYYRDKGITTAQFFEDWTEIENYWRTWTPERAAQIKAASKAIHEAGMKLEVYFGFLVSDAVPEFGFYRYLISGSDTQNFSEGGFNRGSYYHDPEELNDVRAWDYCKVSLWGDHFLRGLEEAIREFDLDGVYLDGTPVCGACTNSRHGCGCVDPYGRKVYTFNILNQRRFNEIFYMIGQKHSKDFIFDVHTAMPCMAMEGLVSHFWHGENSFLYDPLSRTTPDRMAAQFYGPLYGVPIETILRPPYNIELIWAQCWLADSFNRLTIGAGDEWQNANYKAWKIYDQYGLNSDCFVPYFSVKNKTKTDNDKIFVSYYEAKKYLAVVVSNYFSEKPQNVVLDLSAFKGVNLAQAQDVWNGGEVKGNGPTGKFSLTLPGGRMKLLVFAVK